jgi:hypothetical protein
MRKYLFIVLFVFHSSTNSYLFSQDLSEKDIHQLAASVNDLFSGVSLGDGLSGKRCYSDQRTIVYEYQVPFDWIINKDAKVEIVNGLIESGHAETYFLQDINVKYVYYKGDFIAGEIYVSSLEMSSYEYEIGSYINLNGHKKSKGVNFRIKAPVDWEISEGDRPNIVKKFIKDGNLFLISIIESYTFFSRKQIRELLSDKSYLKDFVNEQLSVITSPEILKNQVVTVDTYPAIELKVRGSYERLGNVLSSTIKMWYVFYEDKIVLFKAISFKASDFKGYENLYDLITNSVIFPEQYEQ